MGRVYDLNVYSSWDQFFSSELWKLLIPASNDGIILQKHNEVHIVDKIQPKIQRDILVWFMKRFIPPLITIGLSLLLALLSAALTYSAPSNAQMSLATNAFFTVVTPTPQPQGKSIVGSTDQIVIMGGVISAIIVVPILMSKRSWRWHAHLK